MSTLFNTVQYRLPDKDIQTFLSYIEERKLFQYLDYFLLDRQRFFPQFQEEMTYLASDTTISQAFLDAHHYHVVSRTIDGDYLAANNQQVVVIPKSFHLNDLEYFNMPMIDFWVALEKGEIDSQFLPDFSSDMMEDIEEPIEESSTSPDEPPQKSNWFRRLFH